MKSKILHKQEKSEYELFMENKNFRNSRHYIYNKKNLKNIYRFYAFEIFTVWNPRFLAVYVGIIVFITMSLFFWKFWFIFSIIWISLFLILKEEYYKLIYKKVFYTWFMNYKQLVKYYQNLWNLWDLFSNFKIEILF